MRLLVKIEYLIVPKGTKYTGSGKLGLIGNGLGHKIRGPHTIFQELWNIS